MSSAAYERLEALASGLALDYRDERPVWANSAFGWIKQQSAGTIGAVGRCLVCALLQSFGFSPFLLDGVVLVNGQRIAVKTSLMWEVGGVVKFQNIDKDDEYDHIFCLGIYPHAAYGWLIPKSAIWDNLTLLYHDGLKPQHGGADAWLVVDASEIPLWLAPYGGTLDKLIAVARRNL